MSKKEEFPDCDYAQMQIKFFMQRLKGKDENGNEVKKEENRKGKYRYRSSKMNTVSGSIVLFQFDNKIIASAIYLGFKEEKKDCYKGYYLFDVDSIKIFNPITRDELIEALQLDENFKFGQGLQNLKSDVYTSDELREKVKILITKKAY